uniref:Uncharacterized protein n=1 Tax=Anguilla anguilla TaxID=7936 RepID=A0A0E9S4X5_ANGAN
MRARLCERACVYFCVSVSQNACYQLKRLFGDEGRGQQQSF